MHLKSHQFHLPCLILKADAVRDEFGYRASGSNSSSECENQIQNKLHQLVDTEKEQSEDKGHNKNHDGCDHCLTAGWPNNLRDLGANLLGKLQWIYHSHPRILFKATLVRIAVCVA